MVNLKTALAFGLLAVASAANIHQDSQEHNHVDAHHHDHQHAHGKGKHHAHHHRRRNQKTCASSTLVRFNNSTLTATSGAAATTGAATSTPSVVTVSVIPVPVPSANSSAAATSPCTTQTGGGWVSSTQSGAAPSSPAGVGQSSQGGSAPSSPAGVGQSSQAGSASSSPAGVGQSSPAGAAPTGASTVPAGGSPPSGGAGSCGVSTAYVTVQSTVTVTAGQGAAATTLSTSTLTLTSTSTSVSTIVTSSSTPPAAATTSSAPPPPPAPASSSPTTSTVVPSSTLAPSAPAMIQTGQTSTSPAAPADTSSAASAPVGSYSGGKWGAAYIAGVSYESLGLGSIVPWAYNWLPTATGISDGVEFVPTLHDPSYLSSFASAVESQSNIKFLKHFNEPDNTGGGGGGCDLTPQQAANDHNQYNIGALGKTYALGFPAVTSDNNYTPGQESGLGWLQAFVDQVGCDDFSFADFHFYYTSGNDPIETQVSTFMGYVSNWIAQVDKMCPNKNMPIWISEFSAGPTLGNVGQAAAFMALAEPQLMMNDRVQRYSYFMPSNNLVVEAINSIKSAI